MRLICPTACVRIAEIIQGNCNMTTRLNDDAVTRLLDIQDIQRAIALYVIAVDTRELSLFDQVFVPEAQIILDGVGEMTPASYIAMAGPALGHLSATQHHLGLPVIDLHGDHAHAR